MASRSNINLSSENPSKAVGNKYEEEGYNEEEDVDFNPFLKESPSPAASSSLSSEVEPLEGETIDSRANNRIASLKPSSVLQNLDSREDCGTGEVERARQGNVSFEEPCDMVSQKSIQLTGGDNSIEMDSNVNVMGEVNESGGEMRDMIRTQNSMLNSSEEDAICMRTRARYSLASFSLDELEAFLQETDDEDDVQNANDEDEYHKFLTAVLHGEDDGQWVHRHEKSDDEDNDVDFEIELEELLGSDDEEVVTEKVRRSESSGTSRRPATRQKRQQNISIQSKGNSPELSKKILRPLVPILPASPFACLGMHSVNEAVVSDNTLTNRFSQAQLGQLRSLLHDHMQLLIQVYSLSVLDPSRQNVATQVQGMISEMISKHEESVSQQSHPHSSGTHPSKSILDVPPLEIAKRYLDDVSSAVQDYRRCQVEIGCGASSERVSLFPLPHSTSCQEVEHQVTNSSSTSNKSQSSSGQQKPKKTLAATLVESAKKQSVALVHKDISKLAQRFYPLFKPSLFPHKPPPAAAASRVLFTDAEDELLALGIMEFNSDWKAIQQRFLPSKTKHQIFVRQKNRCSSQALENPIKAIRRMKSSPLTAEEVSRIQEGLKYFKYDWMMVWKFYVPYRDPSLLPRQWRIALGVQKSYKQDEVKKEKRRLYELKRRSRASSTNGQLASNSRDSRGDINGKENNVGDELAVNSGEAYVHEGFLDNWRPDMSGEEIRAKEGSQTTESGNARYKTGSVPWLSPNFLHSARCISNTAPATSSPPITLRPYRARRSHNPRVVRLAPGLPPVNLPPSVRVISQPVLPKNRSEISKMHNISGGISDVSGGRSLTADPSPGSALGNQSCPQNDKVVDLQEDKIKDAEDACALDESKSDSDLQLHPLLFRIPEKGQLTSYSLSSRSDDSNSFSFFSDQGPQLLSLFNSPRHGNLSVDQFQQITTLHGHGAAASVDTGFHPLLQRIEYPNKNDTSGGPNLSPSAGMKGKSGQLLGPYGAVMNTSTANVVPASVDLQPSGSGEKAKTVDLDIHLSSSSSKAKVGYHSSAANTEIQHNHAEHDGSEAPDSSPPCNDINRCMDNIGDNSNFGIVMEQEELSDSDEDIDEENVEFECEEMTDSEGEEGSDCGDKDHPNAAGGEARTEADSGNERELENPISSQSNKSDLLVGCLRGRASARELRKDSRNIPWLRLDLDSRPLTRKASKPAAALHSPSRPCKTILPAKRRDAESKEGVGIARLLSLGPITAPDAKKPRNELSQGPTNVNIDTTGETYCSDNNDRSRSS